MQEGQNSQNTFRGSWRIGSVSLMHKQPHLGGLTSAPWDLGKISHKSLVFGSRDPKIKVGEAGGTPNKNLVSYWIQQF